MNRVQLPQHKEHVAFKIELSAHHATPIVRKRGLIALKYLLDGGGDLHRIVAYNEISMTAN